MKVLTFLGLISLPLWLFSQESSNKKYVKRVIETIKINPDSALELSIKLQKESLKSDDQYLQVQSYFIAGWIYGDVFQIYDSAILNYLRAFEYAQKYNNPNSFNNQISLLKNCGVIARKTGYYSTAIDFYRKGLKIAKRINDSHQVASLSYNLAGIYHDLSEYEIGLQLLNANLKRSTLNRDAYFKNLVRKSHFKLSMGDYDSTILICENALKRGTAILPRTKFAFNHNLIVALAKEGNLTRSSSLLEEIVEELKDQVSSLKIASLLEDFASVLVEKGEYVWAESILQRSLGYLTDNDREEERFTSVSRDVYLKLSKISLLLGKVGESKYYSLLYENELQSFNQLNQRYNINLLLDNFYSNYEKKEQSVFFSRLIGWLLMGFIVLLLSIFLFNRFQYYKSQKLLKSNEINRKIAELKALKAQINPHFLFNSLNSIQSFILEGKDEIADEYLVRYSLLMRKILNHSATLTVPIKEEIDILQLYVALERVRLGSNFDFIVKIAEDIDQEVIYVPSMIIQPFIENAIWHGISKVDYDGLMELSFIRIDNDEILVMIQDNGVGINEVCHCRNEKEPRGEQLVRDRLELLNQIENNFSSVLEISNRQEGGTTVKFRYKIPT